MVSCNALNVHSLSALALPVLLRVGLPECQTTQFNWGRPLGRMIRTQTPLLDEVQVGEFVAHFVGLIPHIRVMHVTPAFDSAVVQHRAGRIMV